MKRIKVAFSIITLVLGFNLSSFSQGSKATLQPNIGIASPILDEGLGFSMSLNGHQPLNSYFGLEGQIAYIYSNIKGSFISGKQGSINSISAMAGLRLYFNPKDKYRFYINGLVGYNAYKEILDGTSFKEKSPGMSLGAFFEMNRKYVAGLSLEAPEFIVLRFGYIL